MSSVRTLAGISAAMMLSFTMLVACGDDSSSESAETPVATAAIDAAGTTAAAPATTVVASTVPAVTSTSTPLSGPVQIDVVVGVDSNPDRVEYVTVGAEITLNITNPNADDEFHVHGIDIEQAAAAGQMATINFTIDAAGTYAVESHITGDVFVVIEAS